MKKRQISLQEILADCVPNTPWETVEASLLCDLDADSPKGKVETAVFLFKEWLRVYVDRRIKWEVKTEQIASFVLQKGVGCVYVECCLKNGERVVLAKGTTALQEAVAAFVRQSNRALDRGERGLPPRPEKPRARRIGGKRALLRLLKMAKGEWKYILISILIFLITTAIGILIPYINRLLIDGYIRSEQAVFWQGFLGVVFSLLAANLFQRLFTLARSYFLTVAGNRLIVRLRGTVFRKIGDLSIAKVSGETSGELMKRVNGDTAHIKQFLIDQLPGLIEQALLLVAISTLLFFADWRLALFILLPAPLVVLGFRLFWRAIRTLSQQMRSLNARGNAVLHDIFSGIRVVKSYGMEKQEEARFVGVAEKEMHAQLRREKFWAILMPVLQLLMGMGEYILLYYVGNKMLQGSMTAGEMSQLSSYSGMIYAPLSTLLQAPRMLIQMLTSVSAVFSLLDEPQDVPDHPNAQAVERLRGEIEVDHISFGYDGVEEVLRDVSLSVRPGEFVGLVGRSGVGKSTLINLIMRMYDVEEGSIRIDGRDVREISQKALRSNMGVVLQENFLFTGTVWQNLTYAKPDATVEEVIRAAKSAGAHEFIVNLPEGYETRIGERGHTLSGGERQRIAIARALLHDPAILILDEATSALDTETEKLIQDALRELTRGRTTIAIAHRLSTLRNATRLVVLDEGRVAEEGSHDELMEKQGIYYGLVMAQREMTRMDREDPEADE